MAARSEAEHRADPVEPLSTLLPGLERDDPAVVRYDRGLAPRALNDIRAAVQAGRFEVEDTAFR